MRGLVPYRLRALLGPARRRVRGLAGQARYRIARHGDGMDHYRYVFVVTYGRSGSTLLTGLLNSIPGYRIRGENYNALYRLYQADAAINRAYGQFSGGEHLHPRSAWYGTPLTRPHRFRADLVAGFVANVLCPRPGDRVLGFKEIRYTPVHLRDLAEYLEFLRQSFPGCKIIFNHRDPAAVAASGWWVNVAGAEDKVRAADRRFLEFPADDRHFHFHYDDIDDGLGNIRELFGFLGEDMDQAAVRRVLASAHGPYTRTAGSASA